jgi:hypothetical protein
MKTLGVMIILLIEVIFEFIFMLRFFFPYMDLIDSNYHGYGAMYLLGFIARILLYTVILAGWDSIYDKLNNYDRKTDIHSR